MQFRRFLWVTAVFITAMLSLSSLIRPLQAVSSAPFATTLLYDSSLGTTPSQQNFGYQEFGFAIQASQTYSAPVTVFNTASQLTDYAGYTVTQAVMPSLNRAAGFRLSLDLRLVSENHNGNDDRAGFSFILLSEDLYGVEMAFWENEIWVQEGNGNLFKHAEGTPYDTTAALTTYELTVIGQTYLLSANGVPRLSGSLRQYTDWNSAPLPFDPYEVPNQLFLGDDTSSAGAEVWLGDVSISTDVAPTVNVGTTAVSLAESSGQTTFAIELNMPSPMTTTVQYSLTSGTAVAGADFAASSGILTFSPGSSSQNIVVELLPDALPEPDETFSLQLSQVENGILGVDTAVFTILDDDEPGFMLFLPFTIKP